MARTPIPRLEDVQAAIRRKSHIDYVQHVIPAFKVNWHHRLISSKLEAVARGEIRRLQIWAPPRHSKTWMVSDTFPAWFLGNNPSKTVIGTSYSDDVVTTHGRMVRNFMQGPEHIEIFGKNIICPDSQAANRFDTIHGGSYNCAGVGGGITSKGGHIIIADDLYKDSVQAHSDAYNEHLHEWWRYVILTRQAPNAAIIFISTRWTEDDMNQWLIDNQDPSLPWEVVRLAAIRDDEELDYDPRQSGEALFPEMFPIEELECRKREQGGLYVFNASYQQAPSPKSGDIIKRDDIQRYTTLPDKIDEWIASWDLTFDSSVSFVEGQVWARKGPDKYLVHEFRKQIGFTDTCRAIEDMRSNYPEAILTLVEKKANGAATIETLRKKITGIKPVNPTRSKTDRLRAVSPDFESRHVYVPKNKEWTDAWIEEIVSFGPNSKESDRVDATTQALSYFESKKSGNEALAIEDIPADNEWSV